MGDVAGLEVGLPSEASDIDAVWMTAVLRTSGVLGSSESVASVSAELFGEGVGLMSRMYRLELTYEGDATGPLALVAKLPTGDPLQLGTAELLGLFQREVLFYREFAQPSPISTPTVHAAMIEPGTTDHLVLMEHLDADEGFDQVQGATWDQALVVANEMAKFHAHWHLSPRLDTVRDTFLPANADLYRAALGVVFAGGWDNAKTHGSDVLAPEVIEFGDRYGELVPFLLDEVQHPETLVHGDWRLDNMMFVNGEPSVIDFQVTSIGTGIYDLGYFVGQSLTAETRAGRSAELVTHYIDAMADLGVTLDRAETMRQFKIVVARCLIYAVTSFQAWDDLNDRGRLLLTTILGRSSEAIMEIDALAELPM